MPRIKTTFTDLDDEKSDAQTGGTGVNCETESDKLEAIWPDGGVKSVKLLWFPTVLTSQGAWPQFGRLKGLRHEQVSHGWPSHLDAPKGGVLTAINLIDFAQNVQKRLGNQMYNGQSPCLVCGAFLDARLEHCETCSTAEATRGAKNLSAPTVGPTVSRPEGALRVDLEVWCRRSIIGASRWK